MPFVIVDQGTKSSHYIREEKRVDVGHGTVIFHTAVVCSGVRPISSHERFEASRIEPSHRWREEGESTVIIKHLNYSQPFTTFTNFQTSFPIIKKNPHHVLLSCAFMLVHILFLIWFKGRPLKAAPL